VKRFVELFSRIDTTTRTTEKVDAMVEYFTNVDARDGAWAVHFLSGGRPKRLIPVRKLASWASEVAQVPDWLFEECYNGVGDLAETIALLLPDASATSELALSVWVEERLYALAALDEEERRARVLASWAELSGTARLVWNKLITGNFRVGVSQQLVIRALARVSGLDEGVVAHRLSGTWMPTADAFLALLSPDADATNIARPYPFFLAYPLEDDLQSLGAPEEWQAEWKWDGIRAQVVRREGRTFIWTRGEELVTERFPEVAAAAAALPDGTVVDGELMPWRDGTPLPFAQLQRRIGRTKLGPKILGEVPVALIAYDLLEVDGADVREQPLAWRRNSLLDVIPRSDATRDPGIQLLLRDHDRGDTDAAEVPRSARDDMVVSPTIAFETWEELSRIQSTARDRFAEGLMLKKKSAPYGVGRRKGGWWKWKVSPLTVDAVLIYAQPGHGRRALLHTDYTFAVWDGETLVPFAKAYSGLTDAEIRQLDAWIRRNTVERFGPVRSVKPQHVFELAFEGIQRSTRHKSGVAVRFPRINRWRTDKAPADADTIETLRALIDAEASR
jgi:DNA ligase-1